MGLYWFYKPPVWFVSVLKMIITVAQFIPAYVQELNSYSGKTGL